MKTEVKKVTPGIAQSWLRKNTRNRTINDRVVRALTANMVEGKWKDNGETVKFDTNGTLVDGQHRLTALVRAGVTYDMIVVTGLDPDVFDTVDIGRGRSGGDALEVLEVKNHGRVASALAVVDRYDCGITKTIRSQVRANRVVELLDKYPDMVESVEELGKKRSKLVTQSAFDGFYYVFRRRDPIMALEFMSALRDGLGVDSLNAWVVLRERLIANVVATRKMDEVHVAALMVKAWNCAREGRDMNKIPWSPGRETFPIAV